MKTFALVVPSLISITFALSFTAFAANTATTGSGNSAPCAKMVESINNGLKTSAISAADRKRASALVAEGLKRCKADDYSGANSYFIDALKMLHK
ncbi:hypothetical protein ACXHXG_18210 [Rhizobium sp. LEGMi198b]|uniref:hypothetical protein n=1 Tax=unclassified Rhizobium TaxID=2613769 RepID=UPI000CDF38B2|nr:MULTISPECIES: hypothetical protein [Rhizobium]AVA23391.1 hypothetical protein NXC24_CH03779 [Rhizobium sp. NXC24]MDK4739619.1 hypothetical protein [Rhizobium sp. CNPSo 3464]UWU20738.1 hypothetical protein N2601_15885 [Rhizobium tropici]WFU01540.1 hypothetical protein QA648_15615 [Rhizobium sp. CB3171]